MNGKKESSVLEFLDDLIKDSPQVQRTGRRERLRLELARFMKKAREAAGLTQKEVAEVLSVTQAWVSKLESPNYDHKLESVLSYFDAIGGEMNLSVDVRESTFQIWGAAPAIQLPTKILESEGRRNTLLPSDLGLDKQAWGCWRQDPQETSTTRSACVVEIKNYMNTPDTTQLIREAKAT